MRHDIRRGARKGAPWGNALTLLPPWTTPICPTRLLRVKALHFGFPTAPFCLAQRPIIATAASCTIRLYMYIYLVSRNARLLPTPRRDEAFTSISWTTHFLLMVVFLLSVCNQISHASVTSSLLMAHASSNLAQTRTTAPQRFIYLSEQCKRHVANGAPQKNLILFERSKPNGV